VNWISPQSVPEPLPAYSAGAARSGLVEMLERGHQGVKLGPDEIRTIALWIDLGIPYCGDYAEANAWTDSDRQWYEYNRKKRARAEAVLNRRARFQEVATSAATLREAAPSQGKVPGIAKPYWGRVTCAAGSSSGATP